MGRLQNLRTVKAWADEAYAGGPRWARILRVGPRVGPFTRILLEVHYGDQPAFEASELSWVPRGAELQVGQDVAIKIATGDNHTSYQILWGEPPPYGTPRDETVHPVERLARAMGDDRPGEADVERARRNFEARRQPEG